MALVKSVHTDKAAVDENNKRLVLGCGALVYDLLRLVKQNPSISDKVNIQCLPASWHNSPQLIAPGVEDYLSKNAHLYKDVYIAYADCGTGGALDKVVSKYQAKRIDGAHCYEFFAGTDAFEKLSEVGFSFRLLSMEQMALILIEQNKLEEAKQLLMQLVEDSETSGSLYRRSNQLLIALGGDLSDK